MEYDHTEAEHWHYEQEKEHELDALFNSYKEDLYIKNNIIF